MALLIVLTLIARQKKKAKLQKAHTKRPENRSEIIGINLTGRNSEYTRLKDGKKYNQTFIPEIDEKQKGWGPTIKEWRKLTEHINRLKREIAKNKQNESEHKKQLAELTNLNKQLKYEIAEYKQIDKSLKKQIEQLTSTNKQSLHEFDKKEPSKENPELRSVLSTAIAQQTQQNSSLNEQSDKDMKPQSVESSALHEQPQNKTFNQSQINGKQKEGTDQTEGYKNHKLPIDVKEIKAVAELAKSLKRNNRQQQSK